MKKEAQDFLKIMSFTVCLYLYEIPSSNYRCYIDGSMNLEKLIKLMEEEDISFHNDNERTIRFETFERTNNQKLCYNISLKMIKQCCGEHKSR